LETFKIYFGFEVNKNPFKTICVRKKMLYICPTSKSYILKDEKDFPTL